MTLIATLKKARDEAIWKVRVARSQTSQAKTFSEWQIAYYAELAAEYHADNLELALGVALQQECDWWTPGMAFDHKPGSLEDTINNVLEHHPVSDQ
jgi:hypothetical protein